MTVRADQATLLSILLAACLAALVGVALAHVSWSLGLAIGLGLAVLIAAIASSELALYLLIFSMLLGPEVLVGGLGSGSVLGRGITLRADDFLILIIGFAWLTKSAIQKEVGLTFRTPLNPPIATYAFAAIFATGLGMIAGRVSVLGGSLFVVKYIQYFVIYLMVVNHLRERRQFERFLLALLLTVAVVSLVGILQIPSGYRVSAPFEGERGEPNTLGGYLVLMLSLVAGLYLTSRSLKRQALLAGLAVLIFVPLLFTLSRVSYLAVAVMAVAFLLLSRRRLLIASVLAMGLVLAPFVLPGAVTDRLLYIIAQEFHPSQVEVGGVRLDTSTSARVRSWQESIFVDWAAQPVFGYGVTGGRFLDAQYPRVLVETGLVGLLAFLWLQLMLFRRARAIFRAARDPLYKGVALGFLGGFISLVVHSLGANTFVIVRIMEPFWFLAAMVMMIPALEASQPVLQDESSLAPAGGLVPVRW